MRVDLQNQNSTPVHIAEDVAPGWNWTRIALGSAVVVGLVLSYSQLWQTTQKVAEASEILFKTAANVGPAVVNTVNDGYDLAKGALCAVGGGISTVRQALQYTGVETPPLPTTDVDTAVLGSTFGLTYAATSFAAQIAAPVISFAMAPFTGASSKVKLATHASALGFAAIQTAAPGQMGAIASAAKKIPGNVAHAAYEKATELPDSVKTTLTGVAAIALSYLGSVVAAARYRSFI